MSTMITGTVNGGRFGISVVNLGDLNNDGFEGTQSLIICYIYNVML